MTPIDYLMIAGAVVGMGGIVYFTTRKSKDLGFKKGQEVVIPASTVTRKVGYGYYGNADNQVEEVKDHTNLHWEAFWGWDNLIDAMNGGIASIKASSRKVVLDLDRAIFEGLNVRMDAEILVRALFDTMRKEGVLDRVWAVVPKDEPNLPGKDVTGELPQVVGMLRRVLADYPELQGVKVGCIYAGNKGRRNAHLFDIYGVDDYDAKSGILGPNGEYAAILAELKPGQSIWLIPGGYVNQDPTPFKNFSDQHEQVDAIIPFLWADNVNGEAFLGIRSIPAMREAYVNLGKSLV